MPDGETMRKGVDGGWPGLLELFAKEVSAGNDSLRSGTN
jgi:hypothetical protein